MKIHILLLFFGLCLYKYSCQTYGPDELEYLRDSIMQFRYLRIGVSQVTLSRYQNNDGICCENNGSGGCKSECRYFLDIQCGSTNLRSPEFHIPPGQQVYLTMYKNHYEVEKGCFESQFVLSMNTNGRTTTFARMELDSAKIAPGTPAYYPDGNDLGQPGIVSVRFSISKVCSTGYGPLCDIVCQVTSLYTQRCDPFTGKVDCRAMMNPGSCSGFIDQCSSNPCRNGGTCVFTSYITYTCVCTSGFRGRNCEDAIVNQENCNNNGITIPGRGCFCFSGFFGSNCQNGRLAPILSTCLNGGTLHQTSDARFCICVSNRNAGIYCEHTCPLQCVNGICTLINGAPVCSCYVGFTGVRCNVAATRTVCPSNNLCRNRSECQVSPETGLYFCVCTGIAFTGKFCADIACDDANICVRGACIVGVGCNCETGYTGSRCDMPVCSAGVCSLQGQCLLPPGSLRTQCVCNSDYTGEDCSQHCPGGCGSFGICVSSKIGPKCNCNEGFFGTNCNLRIEEAECEKLECLNGGICSVSNNQYSCFCPELWSGLRCEISTCNSNNCVNGVCLYGVGCICQDSWTGISCTSLTCWNGNAECSNNGICIVNNNVKTCVCDSHRSAGPNCQFTCDNFCINGQCQLSENGAVSCKCDPNFTGASCDTPNLTKVFLNSSIALAVVTGLFAVLVLTMLLLSLFYFTPEKALAKAGDMELKHIIDSAGGTTAPGWETWKLEDQNQE